MMATKPNVFHKDGISYLEIDPQALAPQTPNVSWKHKGLGGGTEVASFVCAVDAPVYYMHQNRKVFADSGSFLVHTSSTNIAVVANEAALAAMVESRPESFPRLTEILQTPGKAATGAAAVGAVAVGTEVARV